MKKLFLIVSSLTTLIIWLIFFTQNNSISLSNEKGNLGLSTKQPQKKTGSGFSSKKHIAQYQALKKQILLKRREFYQRYQKANKHQKHKIIHEAKQYITVSFEKLSDYWLGTTWDFNGVTQLPQTGKIACGYFVTTILRDLGFRINRTGLAQQAAVYILKTMTTNKKLIHSYSNLSIGQFTTKLNNLDNGLYIVGLDRHVGFILKKDSRSFFIHSSYYVPPLAVVKERVKATMSSPLADSKYRIIGNIVADQRLIVRWLKQKKFKLLK